MTSPRRSTPSPPVLPHGSNSGAVTAVTTGTGIQSSTNAPKVGDFLLALQGLMTATGTESAQAFTWTGATFGAVVLAPTRAASTIGADISLAGFYAPVTVAGSGAVSSTVTHSATAYGPNAMLRIHEVTVLAGAAGLTATSTLGAAAVREQPAAVALTATSTLGAACDCGLFRRCRPDGDLDADRRRHTGAACRRGPDCHLDARGGRGPRAACRRGSDSGVDADGGSDP
jgi:hypothetical protein